MIQVRLLDGDRAKMALSSHLKDLKFVLATLLVFTLLSVLGFTAYKFNPEFRTLVLKDGYSLFVIAPVCFFCVLSLAIWDLACLRSKTIELFSGTMPFRNRPDRSEIDFSSIGKIRCSSELGEDWSTITEISGPWKLIDATSPSVVFNSFSIVELIILHIALGTKGRIIISGSCFTVSGECAVEHKETRSEYATVALPETSILCKPNIEIAMEQYRIQHAEESYIPATILLGTMFLAIKGHAIVSIGLITLLAPYVMNQLSNERLGCRFKESLRRTFE